MNFQDIATALQTFLDSNLFILLLTLFIGAISAFLSYHCTKKIRFFDVYMENKISSYNDFFDALSKFQKGQIGQDEFAIALYKTGFFTSKNAYRRMCIFFEVTVKTPLDSDRFSEEMALLIISLREDIDRCRKFKFR